MMMLNETMNVSTRKKIIFSIAIIILICMIVYVAQLSRYSTDTPGAAVVLSITEYSPFIYSFNEVGTLNETGSMRESPSPYWWVNSGGRMNFLQGYGETIQGSLPDDDVWRKTYAQSNSRDTDNGLHPQNIFRLITKYVWRNVRQEAYFMIMADRQSNSPNRNESNGMLLMSRYENSDNLYYAGVRVDGMAVIKKKRNGVYYILAEIPIVKGIYNRESNRNILPKQQWIGMRSEIRTLPSGEVFIELYTDVNGVWRKVLSAVDDGKRFGTVIHSTSYAGIRTDFMDVRIKGYRAEEM